MIKRVVVAGCRNYNNYREAKEYIDFCLSKIRKRNELIFLSGHCRGADLLGERYAEENGFKIERYIAEWDKYGRGAGPKRNKIMADKADYVICFWDGQSKGTKAMIDYVAKIGKPLRIKRI
ncbi:MAG: DUF2493 domain-containing protein [Clostridia bacterium]|nr:DUF2493 domain-containing protein [Clostridia bacterium]